MRLLAAVLLGALLSTGATVTLVHDYTTPQPTTTRAVFHNLAPYKPPPTTRSQYNSGSGG
jgi:hypothetical protein